MTDEELHASLVGSARKERDAVLASGMALTAGVFAYRCGIQRDRNPLSGGALGHRWARGWDIARSAAQARLDKEMRRAACMARAAAGARQPYAD